MAYTSTASCDGIPCPDAFWLDGCSWGCGYYSGLIHGLHARWGDQIFDKRWGGASAGAVYALGASLGVPLEEFHTLYSKIIRQGRSYGTFLGQFTIYLDGVLRQWLFKTETEPKDISSLNGKLFIGITAFPCQFVLKSNWVDVYDIMDTIHASVHIPWYLCHIEQVIPPQLGNLDQTLRHRPDLANPVSHSKQAIEKIKKKSYIDGGLSRNCDVKLCVPGVTLNISPLMTSRVGAWDCIYPMSMERFEEIFQHARLDVLEFSEDQQFDFAPCGPVPSMQPSKAARRKKSLATLSLCSDGAESEADMQAARVRQSSKPSALPSPCWSRRTSIADARMQSDRSDKDPGCSTITSFLRLQELLSGVQPKSQSIVMVPCSVQRSLISVCHSKVLRVGRYGLALILWANRFLEYPVYKHCYKLSITIASLLMFLLKRVMNQRRSKKITVSK